MLLAYDTFLVLGFVARLEIEERNDIEFPSGRNGTGQVCAREVVQQVIFDCFNGNRLGRTSTSRVTPGGEVWRWIA